MLHSFGETWECPWTFPTGCLVISFSKITQNWASVFDRIVLSIWTKWHDWYNQLWIIRTSMLRILAWKKTLMLVCLNFQRSYCGDSNGSIVLAPCRYFGSHTEWSRYHCCPVNPEFCPLSEVLVFKYPFKQWLKIALDSSVPTSPRAGSWTCEKSSSVCRPSSQTFIVWGHCGAVLIEGLSCALVNVYRSWT